MRVNRLRRPSRMRRATILGGFVITLVLAVPASAAVWIGYHQFTPGEQNVSGYDNPPTLQYYGSGFNSKSAWGPWTTVAVIRISGTWDCSVVKSPERQGSCTIGVSGQTHKLLCSNPGTSFYWAQCVYAYYYNPPPTYISFGLHHSRILVAKPFTRMRTAAKARAAVVPSSDPVLPARLRPATPVDVLPAIVDPTGQRFDATSTRRIAGDATRGVYLSVDKSNGWLCLITADGQSSSQVCNPEGDFFHGRKAVTLTSVRGDPDKPSFVQVAGIAAPGVAEVSVDFGSSIRTARPGPDGGFSVVAAGALPTSVETTSASGTVTGRIALNHEPG